MYICIMKTITYHKSHSGQTIFNHIILNDEDISQKTYASLILLNEALKELDVDFIEGRKKLEQYLSKRQIYLESKQYKDGSLSCHYCGKKDLEIGFRDQKLAYLNNKNKKLATIDHIIPVSSGTIDSLDENNWLIACKKCNSRKGSMSYIDFISKIKK